MQGSKFVLAAAGEKETIITVSSVAVLCDIMGDCVKQSRDR